MRIDEVRDHLGQVGARIHAAEIQFRAGTNAGCLQENDGIGSSYISGEDIGTTGGGSNVRYRKGILRRVHHTFVVARGSPRRCVRTVENQVETPRSRGSLIQKEKGFFQSIEKFATFLNCELIKLLEEKKLALSRLSETEYPTRLLLEEQKDYLLS